MPGRFAPWLQTLTKEFNFPLWPSPLRYLSSPPLLLSFSSIVNAVIFFIHCCPRHSCCACVLHEWAKSYLYINYLQTARLSPPLNHKVPVLQKEKKWTEGLRTVAGLRRTICWFQSSLSHCCLWKHALWPCMATKRTEAPGAKQKTAKHTHT